MKVVNELETVDFYEAIIFFDLEFTYWEDSLQTEWL